MIKAIIFDFDGVIVESSDIKTEAFRELFQDYSQKIEPIVNYHLLNEGLSRYVKFRHIYKHILGQNLTKGREIELGERFSEIVLEKILAAPLVTGAKEFFDRNKNRYQFFIVSGTPEEELNKIVYTKRLQDYFLEICGSPREKRDIINGIMKKYDFTRDEVVYIGDAESDRIASRKAGVAFIERKTDFKSKSKGNPWTIEDFTDLYEILDYVATGHTENKKERKK